MTTLPIKSCKNAYRSDFKLSDIVSEILLGELYDLSTNLKVTHFVRNVDFKLRTNYGIGRKTGAKNCLEFLF